MLKKKYFIDFIVQQRDVKVYETPMKLVLLLYFLKQGNGINLCKS